MSLGKGQWAGRAGDAALPLQGCIPIILSACTGLEDWSPLALNTPVLPREKQVQK